MYEAFPTSECGDHAVHITFKVAGKWRAASGVLAANGRRLLEPVWQPWEVERVHFVFVLVVARLATSDSEFFKTSSA
jgi:hypothetical protein